jgi:hypothetical protein
MGISPELDEKITNFLTEIGGLFLLKQIHSGVKSLKKPGGVKSLKKPAVIEDPFMPKGEIPKDVTNLVGKIEQSKLPEAKPIEAKTEVAPKPSEEIVSEKSKKFYGYRNKPIEGTGETKTRGLSKSTEASAIAAEITDQIKDLPEYNVLENKPQIEKASRIVYSDWNNAKQMALGNVRAPNDVLPEFVYQAVKSKALKEGDINTLTELAQSSKLSSEATVMGQRIQALGVKDPLDPVKAMRDIIKTREGQHTLRGQDVVKMKEEGYQQIKKELKRNNPKVNEWQSFLEGIRC